MTVLAAAFVALRFIARCKKRLKIGWDDYIIVVSLVCVVLSPLLNERALTRHHLCPQVLLFGQTACNSICSVPHFPDTFATQV